MFQTTNQPNNVGITVINHPRVIITIHGWHKPSKSLLMISWASILSNTLGIIIIQSRNPYKPTRIQWNETNFDTAQLRLVAEKATWLVVYLPLWKDMSQLGWLFPIITWKRWKKNPKHQPVMYINTGTPLPSWIPRRYHIFGGMNWMKLHQRL